MTLRLEIRRYIAPLTAWIPDLSGYSPRERTMIGIGASLALHIFALLLLVLLSAIFPDSKAPPPPPPRTIELTVVPEDQPPEEQLLALAPNPQRQFLDTTGLDISKVAPPNADFESSENGIAASEREGKGNIPLPSQDGKDLPFLAFKSQRALFGPSPAPVPETPEAPPPQPPSPPAEASPSDPDVTVKPAPNPVKTAKAETPKVTPAPPATPPPKSQEKTETPALAQATPPPLKTVDKVKEDEIAVTSKPPATPPPSTAETEKPQPVAVATPPPPIAAPTPRKETRQVMLVTPSPKTQPLSKSGSQIEREQNRLEGSISNKGRKSVNSIATPLGKYKKQVMDMIAARWQYYVKSHEDVLALGSAKVTFVVDGSGKIRALRIEDNTSNQSFADICERAIREAEIPEPSPEALAPVRDGHVEFSINFTYYSL